MKGRKRHLLVDTSGFIHFIWVHEANVQDRHAAELLLVPALDLYHQVSRVWADGGYSGGPERVTDGVVQIIRRRARHRFEVLPKRWVVERTFAWLVKFRRLRVDYEALVESSTSFILLAMTRLLLRRLTTN